MYVTTVVIKPEQSPKFTSKFHGPYRIIDKISNVLYKLDFKESKAHPLIHVNRLKPCFEADLWNDDVVESVERGMSKEQANEEMERPPTPVPLLNETELPPEGNPTNAIALVDPAQATDPTDASSRNRRYNLRSREKLRRPNFYGTIPEEPEETE